MITFRLVKQRNFNHKVNCLRGRRVVGNIIRSKGFYLYDDFGYGEFTAEELAQITHKCCELNRKGWMSAA